MNMAKISIFDWNLSTEIPNEILQRDMGPV